MIFGHVVQGQEIIKLIENMPTNDQDRPLTNVDISHCGELIIRIKSNHFCLLFIFSIIIKFYFD